jgi:hypothetical protein
MKGEGGANLKLRKLFYVIGLRRKSSQESSPCIVQADAQILELAEGIISIRKIIFLFFFHIFIKDENYNYTW